MRVRVAKSFYYRAQDRRLMPGDVVNIPDNEAKAWLHHGMAMEDKSVDVPEQKSAPVVEVKPEVASEPVKVVAKRRARRK